jgi:hypothetical protein
VSFILCHVRPGEFVPWRIERKVYLPRREHLSLRTWSDKNVGRRFLAAIFLNLSEPSGWSRRISFRPAERSRSISVFHPSILKFQPFASIQNPFALLRSNAQVIVMPAHVRMTGYNRSSTEPLRVVIFYVSDPDTPFLEQIH